MADRQKGDKSGYIYVESDYQNIVVVDPNKTIDSFGNIRERLVDHENLVMYVNLEANVIQRTKLAVGGGVNDSNRTVSVAKMNFLKPTEKSHLTSGYYDELTGKNSRNGLGDNQRQEQLINNNLGKGPYLKMSAANPGNKSVDNGLLGITSISIKTNSSFVPTVSMTLEDIQGRALFQLGDDSPYSAFFNMPYCPFILTLKGYYGQAVRYNLNLRKFNARFNTFSGNYMIELDFEGFKYNILNEISIASLFATPHMYSKIFDVSKSTTSPEGASNKNIESQSKSNGIVKQSTISNENVVTELVAEKGFQKILEVYSEYKAKGIISPDFPEFTLAQLMNAIQTFEKNVQVNQSAIVSVEPLTTIRTYIETLKNYYNEIYAGNDSWFTRYLNPRPIILKGSGENVYVFKQELINDYAKRIAADNQLKDWVQKFNKLLENNPTLGKKSNTGIKNSIVYDTFTKSISNSEIDYDKTITSRTGLGSPTNDDIEILKKILTAQLSPVQEKEINDNRFQTNNVNNITPPVYVFDLFNSLIRKMETEAIKKLSEYETAITAELSKKIEDSTIGLGFKPTVRNICAVIMASTDAFLRLLEDVHTNAWNVRNDEDRRRVILNNPSSAPGVDTVRNYNISQSAQNSNQGLVTGQEPVYPWPQFFVESSDEKKGRFQIKYPGDPEYSDITKGYNIDKWPEVEFVEEYMKGLTQKFVLPVTQPSIDSQNTTNIININAIEYPSSGLAYLNKQELKFFYEIWERQFLTSNYSGFIRGNDSQLNQLITLVVESEVNNIKNSLGVSSPFLTLKLKNYNITAENYRSVLSDFSNQGTGVSYQDFIRDFYVTPYIKSLTENSFSILSLNDIGREPQTQVNTSGLLELVKNGTNEPLVVDTYPFTNPSWVSENMENSSNSDKNSVYNTNQVLTVFEDRDVISNFNNLYNYSVNRPVTNFSYLRVSNPIDEVNKIGLNVFYEIRKDPTFFTPSEGYVNYVSPITKKIVETTTSILNTPYFVNSIQNGVDRWRRRDPYPYTQAAYLFINSLPLASLRERYKTEGASTDLDYIASCFKKFGAIHKMPYAWVLKIGSLWYRYKTYKSTEVDFLDSAWKNFDYEGNFDPIMSSDTKTYKFDYEGTNTITLQNTSNNINSIQTGFYPKVINDFNVFYNGYDLYINYTDEEIQTSINNGVKVFNFTESNIQITSGDTLPYQNVKTWSVIVPNGLGNDTGNGAECNPSDNTSSDRYYIVPSFGGNINQVKTECISNNQPICELLNNQSMYNGSVRLLWDVPNYGFFNNDGFVKPQPDSYVNKIDVTSKQQSPFKLLVNDEYTKIEEVFSVFDKSILDKFESEFLKFSKPIADVDSDINIVVPVGQSPVDPNGLFKNFQYLFRNLMEINGKPTTTTNEEYFNNIGGTQLGVFSNTIKSFLEYDVILRYGNPSQYNRRVMDSYLAQGGGTSMVVNPIQFNPYVKNSLPSKLGSTTLESSKLNNPAAWLTLELEVGFSTIENLKYTNQGSYITDFFIDNNIDFSENNVKLLSPIIKMYATQKLLQTTITPTQFKTKLQEYLAKTTNFQNNSLNLILSQLRKDLPNQQELPERQIKSVFNGEQSKVEFWEMFKALNDKWIAGSDYNTQTLFEDMLFLDKASRNIGDTIILDIFSLKNIINESPTSMKMSVYTFLSEILYSNNFTVMPLPSYVNFWNVRDVSGVSEPNSEESLEFGDKMWGTYLNVDYRDSSPKLVCFYIGKVSEHVDYPTGIARFRGDSFDLSNPNNPLIENFNNKKDYAISNKCVGFNVDTGIRNQNVFYSINVGMDAGKATSESTRQFVNIVEQYAGKNTATQNNGLYEYYKSRSYQCTVQCLGNALLQPTMYFNLRNTPLFNGAYFITEVDHNITSGFFETTFTGTRQSLYDLPTIDKYLQSINRNLLTKIETIVKNTKDSIGTTPITNIEKSKNVTQSGDNTPSTTNSCSSKLASDFSSWGEVQTTTTTSFSSQQFVNEIKKETTNPYLQVLIYMICYVKTFNVDKFYGFNNNFANVELTTNDYKSSVLYFSPKKYSCLNVPNLTPNETSQPIANFDSVSKFLQFMIARLTPNIERIFSDSNNMSILKYYVCNWPVEDTISETYFDENLSEFRKLEKTFNMAFDSAGDANLPVDVSKELKKNTQEKLKKTEQENNGIVNKPNNLNTTTIPVTCNPPTITSFSPLTGVSGTILTIVGNDLNTVTDITFNNTIVTNFNIINNFNISVIVPSINTATKLEFPIIVNGKNGDETSLTNFTYNPQQTTPSTPITPAGLPDNTNTQPQQTGPIVLNQSKTYNNFQGVNKLTVTVNPLSGEWNIMNDNIKWIWTAVKVTVGPNNTILEEKIGEGTYLNSFQNNVTTNKQTFEITDIDILGQINEKINDENKYKEINKVYNILSVSAKPKDSLIKYNTTNNPNDIINDITQPFDFLIKQI